MSDLVTDTAVLPIGEGTVWFVSGLLSAERVRRGRRALGCDRPAVLVLRWFVDGIRVGQLAVEAPSVHPPYIATCPRRSTCSQPPHPACPAPCSLPAPLGTPVHLDGTLIRTDRSGVVGPTGGVDLCWSGQHHQHGGNVEVVTAPDGWPRWTSPVRPGRAHGTARAHAGLLDTPTAWADAEHAVRADLGDAGEDTQLTCPVKNTRGS